MTMIHLTHAISELVTELITHRTTNVPDVGDRRWIQAATLLAADSSATTITEAIEATRCARYARPGDRIVIHRGASFVVSVDEFVEVVQELTGVVRVIACVWVP